MVLVFFIKKECHIGKKIYPMDNNNQDVVTQDELNAESEALADSKEDEIRTTLAEELGLSEDEDSEKLDKLVAREIEHRKTLSTAVRQKIDWRTKAQGDGKGKPAPKKEKIDLSDPEAIRKEAEAAAEAKLEERDLSEMEYSDKVKEQIKKVAKLNGTSVRVAAKDPYIQSMVAEEAKQAAIDEAADNGSKNKKGSVKLDTSKPLNPADYDMSTEEGRKSWEDAKKAHRDANSK